MLCDISVRERFKGQKGQEGNPLQGSSKGWQTLRKKSDSPPELVCCLFVGYTCKRHRDAESSKNDDDDCRERETVQVRRTIVR